MDEVLADHNKLQALVDTWQSEDEIVRLRVANGVRRVCVARPEWIEPYIDHFLDDIAPIDQASTQWTLAKLFELLTDSLNADQKSRATALLKESLETHPDWIVLNNTMETLALWSRDDEALKKWLLPQLDRLTGESRKSVANRANKLLAKLGRPT